MTRARSVIGWIDDEGRAKHAVEALRAAGFSDADLSALFPDREGARDLVHERHTKAPEGACVGVSLGGLAGGALGLLVGTGTIAIPGLGLLIAAGPILAALSAAAAGGALGGVTGALVGLGIPEIEAKAYEGKIRSGNILLAVHAEDRARRQEAARILAAHGAHDVATIGERAMHHADGEDVSLRPRGSSRDPRSRDGSPR